MTLTIYTEDFDKDAVNGGYSGKVFVEDTRGGETFDNLDGALAFISSNRIKLDAVLFNYRDGDE